MLTLKKLSARKLVDVVKELPSLSKKLNHKEASNSPNLTPPRSEPVSPKEKAISFVFQYGLNEFFLIEK